MGNWQKASEEGKQFEAIFEKMCQMQGVAVRKRPLSCKWAGAGQLQLIHSELDFEIIFDGQVRFVDTKSFDSEVLQHNMILEHQATQAKRYMDLGIKSGYVVNFRPVNAVVFFDGFQLTELQRGESLRWDQGEYLGPWTNFCVGNLFL